MTFNNLEELKQAWTQGSFDYPEEIVVADIPYKLKAQAPKSFSEIILKQKEGHIVYSTIEKYKQEAKDAGLEQLIIFIWKVSGSSVDPYEIKTLAPQRFLSAVTESEDEIGDVVFVKMLLGWETPIIKAKVDTGADVSSLHAEDISVVNDVVKFKNEHLSENYLTMPVATYQAVKTPDSGVEYRPVIEFSIEINDKNVKNAMFNLNDRDHMEYPCLIGQNVLEKTKFVVNPRKDDAEIEIVYQDEEDESE